jgi:hypothetical protein
MGDIDVFYGKASFSSQYVEKHEHLKFLRNREISTVTSDLDDAFVISINEFIYAIDAFYKQHVPTNVLANRTYHVPTPMDAHALLAATQMPHLVFPDQYYRLFPRQDMGELDSSQQQYIDAFLAGASIYNTEPSHVSFHFTIAKEVQPEITDLLEDESPDEDKLDQVTELTISLDEKTDTFLKEAYELLGEERYKKVISQAMEHAAANWESDKSKKEEPQKYKKPTLYSEVMQAGYAICDNLEKQERYIARECAFPIQITITAPIIDLSLENPQTEATRSILVLALNTPPARPSILDAEWDDCQYQGKIFFDQVNRDHFVIHIDVEADDVSIQCLEHYLTELCREDQKVEYKMINKVIDTQRSKLYGTMDMSRKAWNRILDASTIVKGKTLSSL